MGVVTVTLNPAIDLTVILDRLDVGTINKAQVAYQTFAGKGINVGHVLRDLKVPVKATGFLGSDNQQGFVSLFARLGITDAFVRVPGSTRINAKLVSSDPQQVTDVNGPGIPIELMAIDALRRRLSVLADKEDIFILSGSLPPGVPDTIYAELITMLKERGKFVVVDTSEAPLRAAIEARPHMIKPNIRELAAIQGGGGIEPAVVRGYVRDLVKLGIETVVVSMGGEGAVWGDAEQSLRAIPPDEKVESTVGAGDSMVAGLVYGRLQGWKAEQTMRFASALSAIAVGQIGVGCPDPSRVDALSSQTVIEIL